MDWTALAAFAEILGSVAVVASLIFVGYQLRQGQSIERANAQRDLLVQANEFISILAKDEKQFDAVRNCFLDFDGAPDIDKERFNAWAFNLLHITEQAYYMHKDGFLNDASFSGFEQGMLAIIRTRGGGQWWKLSYNLIGKDVGNYLAKRLDEIGDSVPPWDELLPYLRLKEHAARQDIAS